MGRELKHVPLDFDWPIGEAWEGYINPYWKHRSRCQACDGTGYNPETKQIRDQWYNFGGPVYSGICYNLTQDDVDALVNANRLYDFTHIVVPGKGWQPKDPPYHPTAEEVNAWARNGPGHDAINCAVCVQARAEKLGVYGYCETCDGDGEVWDSIENKKLYVNWERVDPPTGEGWQVWETVSEGSPVSPVFPNRDALANYLVEQGYSYKAAINFCEDGWVPSGIIANNRMYRDIESSEFDG